MTVSDLIPFAPGLDIEGGVINQAFDSEFAAHLSFPIPIPIAATAPMDKGSVDFLWHAMDAAKMHRKERALCVRKVRPKSIQEAPCSEGDDVVGLVVRVLKNMIPEPLGLRMAPQGLVEVPSEARVSCDVVHHDAIP